jgi:hypothetical protein
MLQRRGDPDQDRRNGAQKPGDKKEHGQKIDEPQGAEGIDQGVEPGREDPGEPIIGRNGRAAHHELERHPEEVEISEMHDLAVDIGTPGCGDAAGQEQAGNEEEIRHAERLRPGDEGTEPGGRAQRLLDAECRMHHDHENDADALAAIDPVEPVGLGARIRSSGHQGLSDYGMVSRGFAGGGASFGPQRRSRGADCQACGLGQRPSRRMGDSFTRAVSSAPADPGSPSRHRPRRSRPRRPDAGTP